MSWHVEAQMMEAYANGVTDDSHAFSIEAHLMSCESCRAQLAAHADRGRLDQLWTRIDDTVRQPGLGPVERLLVALGIDDHWARLLCATRSLSLSWFLAIALALAFAVAAAHSGERGFLVFLVVAPLLPVAGVAAAYGPGVDPTYEIGLASPMSSFNLLLIRASAVLVTSVLLGAVAALTLPELNWTAVAWLLPALGLVAAALALATFLAPLPAAAIVAIAWIAVNAIGFVFAPTPGVLRSLFVESIQLLLLTVTLISGVALLLRRDRFEQGENG
jgi:hypothetical protein